MDRAQEELVDWGLLEGNPVHPTRRLRGAWMRAAAALSMLEKSGQLVAGHPVVNLAAAALEETVPGQWSSVHRDVLAAIQLASLPTGVSDFISGKNPQ